jgi:hypothetical protein
MKARVIGSVIGVGVLLAVLFTVESSASSAVKCSWGPATPIQDGGNPPGYQGGIDCVNGTRYVHIDVYAANTFWPQSNIYTGQAVTWASFGNANGFQTSTSIKCQDGQTYSRGPNTYPGSPRSGQSWPNNWQGTVIRCHEPTGGWQIISGSGYVNVN